MNLSDSAALSLVPLGDEREPVRAGAASLFAWPTPPFADYPAAEPQQDALACAIVGQNGKTLQGRLTMFDASQGVIHVQVPPARTTLPLRLNQFRSLTLTAGLKPLADTRTADQDSWREPPRAVDFRVTWQDAGELSGQTLGHVETALGLFLFLPCDQAGTVQRLFCPRASFVRFELGEALEQMLVRDNTATPAQIAQAVAQQDTLRAQRVGEVLLNSKVVSPEQMAAALQSQSRMPMVRIGEALIALGYISAEQLNEALAQQQDNRNVPLGELLVQGGHVTREDLRTALARKMGYPVVDLNTFPVEVEALRRVPAAAAHRLQVLPLQSLPGGRLVIAIDDPSRRKVLDEVEFLAQGKVVPVLPHSGQIDEFIGSAYRQHGLEEGTASGFVDGASLMQLDEGTDKLLAALEQNRTPDAELGDDLPVEQADNSLVRLINTMIFEAYSQGVSDIHIETHPGREKVRIRFRRDGSLKPYLELSHTYRSALIARLKIMCDLDISERRRPQDGKINFARFVPSCPIELRVATIPTANGLEDAVMRILASAKAIPLDALGLSPHNLKALKEAIERPYGMVLCVGPTGSGKTTTLHSALSHINVPERKIWTAEDPVEITQPGLRQVQVNPKIDWTFAKALRAFLRADPDVIMVGEIRDGETARIAVESSLTGHLVLSTLHTNSAAETVTRLIDMGMDPFNFADSLLAVLAQRLVRKLCQSCRVGEAADAEYVDEVLNDWLHGFGGHPDAPRRDDVLADWQRRFGVDGQLQRYRAVGCEKCEHTGIRGRAGIHELLTVSRTLRHLIQTSARADDIHRQALLEGMRTLRQDGIEKVMAGITLIDEVRATSNV
jgi:type II secretory ATPase GspE/PulE/Tfp pilus assembly ATPase PilB-like protein